MRGSATGPGSRGRTRTKTGAIIVAAGQSTRMGGVDKLLRPLGGRPLLACTLAAFARSDAVDAIVVVASEGNRAEVEAVAARASTKVVGVVLGGLRRRDSVHAGLVALPDCDYVVVHDGARPLVTAELIEATLAAARESGASLCAVPVADTIKRASTDGFVSGTVPRDGLFLAQTPQAFERKLLMRAHAELDGDATDDASLVELLGVRVKLVPGSARNLKVTMPEDLAMVAALLAAGERD